MALGQVQDSAAVASPNFGHLAKVVPLLALHGAKAEHYVFVDPVTALFCLRQFGEVLAQQTAAGIGRYVSAAEPQVDLLRRLRQEGIIDLEVAELFHALRLAGNRAVHDNVGTQRDALHGLRTAWRLGIWFQKAFYDRNFRAGAFVPPPDPADVERTLAAELAQLRRTLAKAEAEAEALKLTTQEQAFLQARAEAEAKTAYDDLAVALELAEESEAKAARLQAEFQLALAGLQAKVAAEPAPAIGALVEQAKDATKNLQLDEAETRQLIDAQLVAAGWEADSAALTHAAGTRPTKGRNLAIAEWPTATGRADYVLFAGLVPLAVVEAKRQNKAVAGSIEQAKRYSLSFQSAELPLADGGPWGQYRLPFLFATNGRPFLEQIKEQSGIWFLDARRPVNLSRPLEGWYTPDGLLQLLGQDHDKANAALRQEPSDYLPLRDYQHQAIAAVEAALASGQRDMLLAMATGTGKTRLALCLIYRLLKAGRFRRVLFLVDRTALGEQALGAFGDVRLQNLLPLTDIYDVKGLGDLLPEADTRLHIATVQGMIQRLQTEDGGPQTLPVDTYDCLIVDECHRGYALDQEMTDSQLLYRSEAEYISKYRRVLDHFDAVRIGLTATQALHTEQIFGPPIFQYTYRQAVLDGNLVDHEPPIRIKTERNQQGIHWAKGEEVTVFDTASGQPSLFAAPDNIDIDVDGFNTKVVTEPFNRAVCEHLASAIDPSLPGKTLVYCATDSHADLVVNLLKSAFAQAYGSVEDDAVCKITGAADKPLEKLRRFKNERLPVVAVTVDLLTTGIDVPAITNLVFLRRVKSRILYEQMLGRATRLCPDLYGQGQHKEYFRIYDAVDIYAALQDLSQMKPVVTRPQLTFAQLVDELLTVPDADHRALVVDELAAKLQIKKRYLAGEDYEAFVALAGMEPASLLGLLRRGEPERVAQFFAEHARLAPFLDQFKSAGGRQLYVSSHPDVLLGTERGYGDATKPEDYLASFKAYLDSNRNAISALLVVTQRPRDLTRQQLRELRLQLDIAGYSETALRTAWAQLSNQDIAASIVGFVRQQALGSALVPYAERVDRAVQRVLASRQWTGPQRQWLERIAKQLKAEVVVDKEALDRGQFKTEGGFARLNKVFGGTLEEILGVLHEEVWRDAS